MLICNLQRHNSELCWSYLCSLLSNPAPMGDHQWPVIMLAPTLSRVMMVNTVYRHFLLAGGRLWWFIFIDSKGLFSSLWRLCASWKYEGVVQIINLSLESINTPSTWPQFLAKIVNNDDEYLVWVMLEMISLMLPVSPSYHVMTQTQTRADCNHSKLI